MDSNQDLNMVAQPSDDPTGAALGLGSTQQQNESEYQAQRRALQQQAQQHVPVEQQQQQQQPAQQQQPGQPADHGERDPIPPPDLPGGVGLGVGAHLAGPGVAVDRRADSCAPPRGGIPGSKTLETHPDRGTPRMCFWSLNNTCGTRHATR